MERHAPPVRGLAHAHRPGIREQGPAPPIQGSRVVAHEGAAPLHQGKHESGLSGERGASQDDPLVVERDRRSVDQQGPPDPVHDGGDEDQEGVVLG